jgi:hypothetical protein
MYQLTHSWRSHPCRNHRSPQNPMCDGDVALPLWLHAWETCKFILGINPIPIIELTMAACVTQLTTRASRLVLSPSIIIMVFRYSISPSADLTIQSIKLHMSDKDGCGFDLFLSLHLMLKIREHSSNFCHKWLTNKRLTINPVHEAQRPDVSLENLVKRSFMYPLSLSPISMAIRCPLSLRNWASSF